MIKRYTLTILAIAFWAAPAAAQDDNTDESLRFELVRGLEQVFMSSSDAEVQRFLDTLADPAWRAEVGDEELRARISHIRRVARAADGLDVGPTPTGVAFFFEGPDPIQVSAAINDQYRIVGLEAEAMENDASGPDPLVRSRVEAMEQLGQDFGSEAIRVFAGEHLTTQLAADLEPGILKHIGMAFAAAGAIAVRPSEEGLVIELEGEERTVISVALQSEPPHLISALSVEQSEVPVVMGGPSFSWDDLESQLADAESQGFSGAVLVVRGGDIVVNKGYGLADRENEVPVTTETMFGVGSAPIDFTTAAILKLAQDGVISLDQPIGTLLTGVPEDKRSITIEHLLSGRSGLANFHHIPGQDDDYDLTWIDRDEAVRRMMAGPLLFAPGTDHSHSHSAFVLLAAIVEITTGATYQNFLEAEIFGPAGMKNTGFYGQDPKLDAAKQAVGYGFMAIGEPNIPANWGPTSWLIMGSGGMVSTPMDFYRFNRFIHSSLRDDYLDRFVHEGPLAGGSDRGFFMMTRVGPEAEAYVMTNTDGPGTLGQPVARAIMELVGNP